MSRGHKCWESLEGEPQNMKSEEPLQEYVIALGHYMQEKSAKSKGTSPARKHPRKRCEMPPRKHARESA